MKKLFVIIFGAFLCFSLASCGPKNSIKELEISGDKMSVRKMEALAEEYEAYFEELDEDDDKNTVTRAGWYSVSLDIIVEGYVDGEKDEDTGEYLRDQIEIKACLDGKVYESTFAYENKASMKFKIEFMYVHETLEGDDEEYTGNIDISLVLVDGICYIKFDGKLKGEDTKANVDGKYFLSVEDLGYYSSISTADASMYIMEAVQELVYANKEELNKKGIDYTYSMYETNKGIGIEGSGDIFDENYPKDAVIFKGAVEYELEEDTYALKSVKAYVDFEQDELHVVARGEIQEARFGMVNKPMNSSSYRPNHGDIEDALSEIFPFDL